MVASVTFFGMVLEVGTQGFALARQVLFPEPALFFFFKLFFG
jgi:hypothetical protein